jgi:hypothetical protein
MAKRRITGRTLLSSAVVAAVLVTANGPPIYALASDYLHNREIDSPDYEARYGHWQVIELPESDRVNAIHAALLSTGKLLIIAGSGNDRTQFDAGTFKTLVFDPVTGSTKLVHTPTDLFCAGHAFLPDGRLLVAGGTQRYEVLKQNVTRAAGTITVRNESPDNGPRTFVKGTRFVAPDGRAYQAAKPFTVHPATKVESGTPGVVKITPSTTAVWVEAEDAGPGSVSTTATKYAIDGLTISESHDIYGMANSLILDKEEYQGRKEAYEFNPWTEEYEQVADMGAPRWYPTLTGLADGRVLAVSGLDGGGQILDGSQNEVYDPETKTWAVRPDLTRYFATYPALFQTAVPDTLFYTGSNTGYGPATKGRTPGFWHLVDNSFTPVPGLRDADETETSGSAWVGPVQKQTLMVVGGGGVGESSRSTRRIDIVRLDASTPHFVPGPDLPEGTRYPSLVDLPDDTVLITNGSRDYRGKGLSDNHIARIYHPDTNTLSYAADPHVGRDYHSEALLLPDGRVLTMGSDPLFADKANTITGTFEQRLELYTPAYLFHGPRPVLGEGPATVHYGQTATFRTPDGANIRNARLIRPSAVTHVTNLEQRSIALPLASDAEGVTVTIPTNHALVPAGYYMLFVNSWDGVPSVARWVRVT